MNQQQSGAQKQVLVADDPAILRLVKVICGKRRLCGRFGTRRQGSV
jgi:hypothetical protein